MRSVRRNQFEIQETEYLLDIYQNVKYFVVNGLPGMCPSHRAARCLHAITVCHSHGDTRAGGQ